MPEGLDPVETGRKLHEHTHEEAERAADREADKAAERHSRILQTGEAILLALVTIAAAWAGYAAAKWGTASQVDIAQSSTVRNLATRADLEALTTRNFDSSTFEAWFTAFLLGNKRKEEIAIRRFRPDFRVAFEAWMATDPLHNPHAPPGPTYMPQYSLPQQATANALDAEATAKFDRGYPRRGDQRRLHPDHRVPGRGAVPGRHRQHVQTAPDPVCPDHLRHSAAHPGRRAAPPATGAAQLSGRPRRPGMN